MALVRFRYANLSAERKTDISHILQIPGLRPAAGLERARVLESLNVDISGIWLIPQALGLLYISKTSDATYLKEVTVDYGKM